MSATNLLKRVGAAVVALAVSANVTAHAKPAGAQLGTVTVEGSLTSGSSLSYEFNDIVSTTGTLVVKATIVGKKLNLKFPVLTITNPAVGTNADVSGTSVSIPSTFAGAAVVHVTATFSGKKIGAQTLPVTITGGSTNPPPPSLTVTTNLYDVGFENVVTLNGSIVPTSGLGGNVTYTWSQTSGKTVSLSTNGVVATSFTTDALTNFVDMAAASSVTVVEGGSTNQVYIAPEHRFGTFGGIALDNQQAGAAAYGFKVLVSNGSVTRTGVFTVACSIQTPAHPNIPVGVTAFYKNQTNSMNWSLVSKPTGSAATLTHTNGLIAALRPDVTGVYVIQDNVTGQTLTNTAANWTGVQFCAICHGPGNNVNQADIVTPWSQTEHATMAQRGVDGVLSSHYNESCFQCHTVGFNQSPAAASNGNFYAVQQQLGWQFPAVLKSGNYASMPAQLQNVANIQCENCHGPGSQHPGSPSISLDEKVCSSCHQDGDFHVYPEEWELSPHAAGYETVSDSEGNNSTCANCHSPQGYIDRTKGLSPIRTGTGPATCQVCHDPHNIQGFPEAAHQVRVYDTVTIGDLTKTNGIVNPNGTVTVTNSTVTLTGKGPSAVCMSCHNARALPYQNAGTVGNPKPDYMATLPHESTATEVLNGFGGANQDVPMGNSFHTYLAECVDCHMYSGGANTAGHHTFSMSDEVSGADNVAACNQCHSSEGFGSNAVTNFDYVSVNAQDYDGNGIIEGVQTEVQGLLASLSNKFADVGITVYDDYPFILASSYTTITNQYPSEAAPIRRALWNRTLIEKEGSFGVHNTQFTVRLLQSSYTDLSTNCISMTTHTNGNPFQVDYPNAFIR
ncbi:MAG TPA: hypothetical protein VMV72_08925 [Verrucomicrobiae bacterium]|nr:hypothetical protein [Verrucomicrobiae bacterium]